MLKEDNMSNITLFGFRTYDLFNYFVVYAFLGWCLETIYATINKKYFVNRGFLNGPFCPIYGFGALMLIVLLNPVKDDLFSLFIGSVALTSVLEYFTGFILEQAFSSVWWDYTDKKFNIKGRICLEFSLIWGAASLVVIKIIHPYINLLVSLMPFKIGIVLIYIIFSYFIFDLTISVISVVGLNSRLKQIHFLHNELKSKLIKLKGATSERAVEIEFKLDELKNKYQYLINKKVLNHSRILNAFPNLKSKRFNHILKDIKKSLEEKRHNI